MQYTISTDRSYIETVNDLRFQGLDLHTAEQIARQSQIAKRALSLEKIRRAKAISRLSAYTHLFD